jgi:hypothetical protein
VTAVETVWDIHCIEKEGNILVFLTGQVWKKLIITEGCNISIILPL